MYARTVTFTFTSDRSVRSAKFEACFRAPPRIDSKDSPYHLDGAHRHVIEELRPNSHVLEIGCGGARKHASNFADRTDRSDVNVNVTVLAYIVLTLNQEQYIRIV